MELLHESGNIIAERYRIIQILGQGGIGTTYEAIDVQNSQRVALKALSLKSMSDWKTSELFEREARVLSVLNHPSIPRYIDYFQVDTPTERGFYIVQQLAPGKPLATLVEEGWHASEAEIQRITIQILEILVYLHQQTPPVIHRDIKPQNIIRDEKGQVFLVDFGAVQDTYHSTFAGSSTVVGTFGYMAPEQFRGQAVPTTDLYGLGATLLFLFTHRSPAELPQDRFKIDFRSRLEISGSFADFLDKMLEPDVEDRFLSAKEALEVLQGKRKLAGQSRASLPWKSLLGVGIAGFAGFTLLNSFKYAVFKSLGVPIAICEGIKYNQIDEFKSYLNQTGDANYIDLQREFPLLTCATFFKNKEIAELLIAKGANVNARDKEGRTPLYIATEHSSKEIAKLLIANGADVNARKNAGHNEGQTPLHRVYNKEIAELLIAKGANVNARDKEGRTPLYMAYNKEIVELLIANGADINAKDNQGKTPLQLAFDSYSWDKVVYLINKGAQLTNEMLNQKTTPGSTPLISAVGSGRKDLVKLLLAKGADVNAKDDVGYTPLHLAVKVSNEVVELLLAKGADVNAKDNFGYTPLHLAAPYYSKEVVKLLLAKGADVNAKDKFGRTPLDYAASHNRKEVLELLLAKDKVVNAKDSKDQH